MAFGLAVLGEIVEFVAGAAGAAQQGGSRRGVVLAIVGAIVGSLAGAAIGSSRSRDRPVDRGLGRRVGRGPTWEPIWARWEPGIPHAQRMAIGRGAFIGRLLGTAGKLIIGVMMLIIITLDSFFDLAATP